MTVLIAALIAIPGAAYVFHALRDCARRIDHDHHYDRGHL